MKITCRREKGPIPFIRNSRLSNENGSTHIQLQWTHVVFTGFTWTPKLYENDAIYLHLVSSTDASTKTICPVPSLHHLMILRAGGRSENLSGVGKVNTINLWTFFLNQLIPTKNIKYFTNFCPSLQKLEIQLLYFFGGIEGMKNMFLDLLTFSKETFTNYDEKKRWVGT